jgi:shikimate dehydrogenase
MTDRYAVIGNPVAHSKSPQIHAEFARETRQDLVYTALYAPLDKFEAAVQAFRNEGGRGMNVTVPFKHRAYELAHSLTPRAKRAHAVNTLVLDRTSIAGDNTDGAGLVRDLTRNLGRTLRGSRILIAGAGGAAYGVCGPLLDESPEALVIANRTSAKAVQLCEHMRQVHDRGEVLAACGYDELGAMSFDVIVNATSAGLHDDMPQLPHTVFAKGALAYEMVYGATTAFMTYAQQHGAAVADGLGMLVEQAAESFYVWRGLRPATAPVIAMLRSGGH